MKLTHAPLPARATFLVARLLVCAGLLGALQACSAPSWLIDRHESGKPADAPPMLVSAAPDGRMAERPPADLVADDGRPEEQTSPAVSIALGKGPAEARTTSAPTVVPEQEVPQVAPVAAADVPAARSVTEPTLLPLDTDLPSGHFAVRIGLFSVESNAYRQAATLRDAVWSQQDLLPEERVIRVLKPDSRYIVLLGDLPDAQSARRLVNRIRRLLHLESIIYIR